VQANWVQHFGFERVPNCHCYTGAFTAPALQSGQAHVRANGFAAGCSECFDVDVNQSLRDSQQAGRRFDAIVLDPPKFAPTAAHA